ncbi:unnamed protein product, partial [Amoebophrya sp. A120]
PDQTNLTAPGPRAVLLRAGETRSDPGGQDLHAGPRPPRELHSSETSPRSD